MPPNILHCWDSNVPKPEFHGVPVNFGDDDNDHYHPEINTNQSPKISSEGSKSYEPDGRTLWKQILRNDIDVTIDGGDKKTDASVSSKLFASLSSIIVLDDEEREKELLDRFGGQLPKVSQELLEGLRKHAPNLNNMSTVADFNDNLFYHMQQERGLAHFDGLKPSNVEELEAILQANEYLGSFLTTKSSLPQPAHVDYPWEVLENHSEDQNLKIGFFPLTDEGMFLQVWPTVGPSDDPSLEVEGQIIFIPHGKLLMIPASTIHGGGFRTTEIRDNSVTTSQRGNGSDGGNLRFHLYIATNQTSLPAHQTNKYTEPHDRTKELSRRYVDSKHMKTLLQNFFV